MYMCVHMHACMHSQNYINKTYLYMYRSDYTKDMHSAHYVFIIIMDMLASSIQRDPPWTMLFAHDLVYVKNPD